MQRTGFVFDVLIVLIFVGIGRSAHSDGEQLAGFVSTTWPFTVGLLVGWTALLLRYRTLPVVWQGVIVVATTVAVAMVLRVIAGQGTAIAFILVAVGFLGAAMLGWRTIVQQLKRQSSTRYPSE